jgi:ABC-type dipeptide/oligopeptide/nickel transport system permease component
MTKYIIRRVILTIPTVLGVTLAVFMMLRLLPGDPVLMMLTEHGGQQAPTSNTDITPEQYENMRRTLGLDKPLWVQFGNYLWKTMQGDLGTSFRSKAPVANMLLDNIPYTFQLAIAGLGVSLVLGLALGIIAGIKNGTWIDGATMTLAVAGVSIPSFWLGLMLLLVFALHLRWLPAVGPPLEFKSVILPAIALGFGSSASVARLMRSSLVQVMHEEYVRTARAKGLRERTVIARHAIRNALFPVVTIVGLQFGFLLSGATVIEIVFARPGLGKLAVNAILEKDFPVIQGTILFTAIVYVAANLLVDLSYAWLDPRIHYE